MRPQNRFLAASVASAATTANALRPVRRTGATSVVAFASGLPTSELPLQAAVTQALLGLVAARDGGRRGAKGTLGLALTAASWAGLASLYREARRSDAVLEQALVDELGSDYRNRIDQPFQPVPE